MTEPRDGELSTGVRAVLLDLPVSLVSAAEAQWRGLLREYLLRSLGGSTQAYGPEEIGSAESALDTVTGALLAVNPDALHRRRHERMDIEVRTSRVSVGDFALLQGVLDDAVRLAHAGDLLMLPPLPEVVALRNWLCDQIVAQAAGTAPTPWSLPPGGAEPGMAPVAWDPSIEPDLKTHWLIGDDQNRIVAASPPALNLLGWTEEQLLGQRLLVVIPPSYREAHLAAFTRSATGGGDRLLGTPLDLLALTAGGAEVPITLTLSRHQAKAGRTVFVGAIKPREPSS